MSKGLLEGWLLWEYDRQQPPIKRFYQKQCGQLGIEALGCSLASYLQNLQSKLKKPCTDTQRHNSPPNQQGESLSAAQGFELLREKEAERKMS
jgi:hypothetical protein